MADDETSVLADEPTGGRGRGLAIAAVVGDLQRHALATDAASAIEVLDGERGAGSHLGAVARVTAGHRSGNRNHDLGTPGCRAPGCEADDSGRNNQAWLAHLTPRKEKEGGSVASLPICPGILRLGRISPARPSVLDVSDLAVRLLLPRVHDIVRTGDVALLVEGEIADHRLVGLARPECLGHFLRVE